ncbi:hypothetical protein C8Q78DRAFT_993756 [Trametes maxima]|nr:hypothetical protein C8Q78DRAFT_993756 [Trametes maxima]
MIVHGPPAPEWWSQRVRVHELEHPVHHGAPHTSSSQKSGPSRSQNTRSMSIREGKKKAAASTSPIPSAVADPPRLTARTVLQHAAKGITNAVQNPRLPQEKRVEDPVAVGDGGLQVGRNIPSIPLTDVDPTFLSEQAIKQRLDTLERQRAHYIHQYARCTGRALDISNRLNKCLDGEGTPFDRDEAIIVLHCAQERLVAARIDALGDDATGQSADEEEEVATSILRARRTANRRRRSLLRRGHEHAMTPSNYSIFSLPLARPLAQMSQIEV